MCATNRYYYFRGRALWHVVGHGRCAGVRAKAMWIPCHESAPTRYVTKMHRKGGIKLDAVMCWF